MMRAWSSRGAAAGLLWVTVGAVGCSPHWDTSYVTENFEIETVFSDPLCEGDLQRWDQLVEGLENNLNVALAPGLGISLWDESSWPDGRWCPKRAVGCYSHRAHHIYATFWSLEHELVHAVAQGALGMNEPFFAEGAAEALQSAPTRFGATLPTSNIGLRTLEVDRITAGHFVRWLWETYGAQSVRELLASKGNEKAFAQVYGVSLASVEARYLEEAPWSYPPMFVHAVPSVPMTGDRLWEESVVLDCASSDAYGRVGGMATIRTLIIETSGYYGVWTSADGLSVSQRQHAIIASEAEALAQIAGDVPAGTPRWLKGGEVHVLELAPGEYEIWITDFDRDLGQAEIAIWAHQGPIPTSPEGVR
jgi:hypothetical protein